MRKENIVLASDLDNTLVYSPRRFLTGEKVCVEVYRDNANSFMPVKSIELLKNISSSITFIPVTTRSKIGFSRIDFTVIGVPKYALVCNGGMLLINGEVDPTWYNRSLEIIKQADQYLQKAMGILETDPNRTLDVRKVENLFVFTKSSNAIKTAEVLKAHLDTALVDITTHKDKIYIIPKAIDKGTGINRLREYISADTIISAGDTVFDIPMLEQADIGYYPEEILEHCQHIKTATCIHKTQGNFSDVFLEDIYNKFNI